MSDDAPVNNPHPVDEDPEEHMGDVIVDPWDEPDWFAKRSPDWFAKRSPDTKPEDNS